MLPNFGQHDHRLHHSFNTFFLQLGHKLGSFWTHPLDFDKGFRLFVK